MGLSGCCCLVKYLLILINFVFWVSNLFIVQFLSVRVFFLFSFLHTWLSIGLVIFFFLRWVWMHTSWLKQKWNWYFKYRVRAFLCWGRTEYVCVNISNFHVNARFQFEAIRFECTMPALNKCRTCVLNTDYSNGNNNDSDTQWWRCRCRRWWKAIARARVASRCWICVKNLCYTIKNTFRKEIKMGAVWWFRSYVLRSTHRMLRCKKCGLNVNRKICAHDDENNLHSPLTRVWCHCRHRYFSFTSHKNCS